MKVVENANMNLANMMKIHTGLAKNSCQINDDICFPFFLLFIKDTYPSLPSCPLLIPDGGTFLFCLSNL
jgi:hypothetical protein